MPDDPSRSGRLRTILNHPILHGAIVVAIVAVAWIVAGRWNRWTGGERYQRTEDAYMAGDVTPLSAKVAGYVRRVAVEDYQAVRAGDLILEIEPGDYQAQLDLALGNLGAAEAMQAQIGDRRAIQHTLVQQAEATILIAQSEVRRAELEASRQRALLQTQIVGTQQRVEQADADARKAEATLVLNRAQLDQQHALLAGLDREEQQLAAQASAAAAQVALARNNLGYTRILAPASGMVSARLVRPGQFVNMGTQVISVVPLPGLWVQANLRETQMTRVRLGNPARVTVDAFPALVLAGRVAGWSPGTGSTFALLPPDNATGNFTKVVQRVPVRILLDPDAALGALVRPGMSVVATVDTGGGPPPAPGPAEGTRP
jgi:membrane fusion protein (multidrug efflux system)